MESDMTQQPVLSAPTRSITPQTQSSLTHTVKIAAPTVAPVFGKKMVLMRQVIGEELRRRRNEQGRTLRDVSRNAQVSLGYLSELERGQKEASSELLAAVCSALDTPLSLLLAGVSTEVARREAMLADRFSIA